MDRFFTLFFVVLLFCSCEEDTAPAEAPVIDETTLPSPIEFDLDQILDRGIIRVAVENNSIGYFSYRGKTMGYQYDLVSELARYLNVEFEFIVTRNIQEAFKILNEGEVDVIAFTLTVTPERKKIVLFADYQYTISQMLVQKKPDNWRDMKLHKIEESLIRNQVDLIGKEIVVRYKSSYLDRVQHLSEEIGGAIHVREAKEEFETEDLILQVAKGEIPFTVADEDIAKVNAGYYPILDVETPVSFPTQISWAVRLNASALRDTINYWQKKIKREPTFNVIYNKYFESPRASIHRKSSEYFSEAGGGISAYDDLIKAGAEKLGWDWRLLAALIYRESEFDPNTKSWVGATGLMQVMPATAAQYGITDLTKPNQNIHAGVQQLAWLSDQIDELIPDLRARLPFVIASYNVGLGHVMDARALAEKYGDKPNEWFGSVDKYMLLKSKPKYYNDPVVKHGYARGSEPVKYVESIRETYRDYRNLFEADSIQSTHGLDVEMLQDVSN